MKKRIRELAAACAEAERRLKLKFDAKLAIRLLEMRKDAAELKGQLKRRKLNRRRRNLEYRMLRLQKRIKQLEFRLSPEYSSGKYTEVLGIKPDTPCCPIEDKEVRAFVKKAVVDAVLGKRPHKAQLCHRCDNGKCVRAEHLFWGTAADNMRDCVLKNRRPGRTFAEKQEAARQLLPQLQTELVALNGTLVRVLESLRVEDS